MIAAINESRGAAASPPAPVASPRLSATSAPHAIYSLALAASISLWFLAIRSPLWLDETSSYWQISASLRQILPRRGQVSAAYPYILWLTTRLTGTSELALRLPSVLAMLAAVYLLFRAAKELFDNEDPFARKPFKDSKDLSDTKHSFAPKELFATDLALIAVIVFSIHPVVVFASIDARPYAFGALAINAAILMLVRLRRSQSNWLAAAFGVASGASLHFQLLFGTVLVVLAVFFLAAKLADVKAVAKASGVSVSAAGDDLKTLLRQSAIAFAAFTLVFLPILPDLLHIFTYRQAYVFERTSPRLVELASTISPVWSLFILIAIVLIAALIKKIDFRIPFDAWRFFFCASLGLVPLLILYAVSAFTPTNIFIARYRLVAISGLALAWAWLMSRIDSRALRLLFCVALVSAGAWKYLRDPDSRAHAYTWKYALELAEKNAAPDHAPVLICSDFPSADYFPMPVGDAAKNSAFFTQLSYYKLSAPVVGLPRALNDEAIRIGSDFVRDASLRRQRFLALGYRPSLETLRWLRTIAQQNYDVRTLGQPDGILVLEFDPRPTPTAAYTRTPH